MIKINFTDAIKFAHLKNLARNKKNIVLGLGMTYPNEGLYEKFKNQVFDTPVSEMSITGMAVGLASQGFRPCIVHGRVEFAMLAFDQIFTHASRWDYMFGGNYKCPVTFRIAIGRQWGNGPQHTQALYSLFGNIVGLKVVIPSSPKMAKGLLLSAVRDNSPVVFLEPRWLYQTKGIVPEAIGYINIDRARIVREGTDVTLVAYGDGLVDSYKAAKILEVYGISAEVIDLVSINPIDHETILISLEKTNQLVCVDTTNKAFCVGNEIIGNLVQLRSKPLLSKPISISCPNIPCPTATSLTDNYYPTKVSIANTILAMFGKPAINIKLTFEELNLAPTDILDI